MARNPGEVAVSRRSHEPRIGCVLPLLLLLAAGCASPPASESGVTHVVICWLHAPVSEEARQRVIDASSAFERIPGVRRVSAGRPLSASRPVVDDSFHVGIVMEFESPEALDAYLEHPEHQKATREVLRPLAARVVVYDFAH